MPARGLRSNRDGITTRQIQQPTSGPLPDSASPTKNGTVTSVGLTVPSRQSVAGSPVTKAGTLAVTDNPQSANQVFAGPVSGGAAVPGFRALVAEDLAGASGFVGAKALRTTDQSTSNNSTVTLSFDSVEFDHGGFWDSGAPTKLVVPSDGIYLVGAGCQLRASGTDTQLRVANIDIKVNGSRRAVINEWGTSEPGSTTSVQIFLPSTLLSLEEGDEIECSSFGSFLGTVSGVVVSSLDPIFLFAMKVS